MTYVETGIYIPGYHLSERAEENILTLITKWQFLRYTTQVSKLLFSKAQIAFIAPELWLVNKRRYIAVVHVHIKKKHAGTKWNCYPKVDVSRSTDYKTRNLKVVIPSCFLSLKKLEVFR